MIRKNCKGFTLLIQLSKLTQWNIIVYWSKTVFFACLPCSHPHPCHSVEDNGPTENLTVWGIRRIYLVWPYAITECVAQYIMLRKMNWLRILLLFLLSLLLLIRCPCFCFHFVLTLFCAWKQARKHLNVKCNTFVGTIVIWRFHNAAHFDKTSVRSQKEKQNEIVW